MKTTASRLNLTTTDSGVGLGQMCRRNSGLIPIIGFCSEKSGFMKAKNPPANFSTFEKVPLVEAEVVVPTALTP